MRNAELITRFINGETEGKGSNLIIEGQKLINYSTVIAFRKTNGTILLNRQHYSPTTSVHQNRIYRESPKFGVIEYPTEEEFNAIVKTCEVK